jgi:hypothetical protein
MKKLTLIALVSMVTVAFSLGGAAFAGSDMNGQHYNLNIIGFAQCTKTTEADPDCFKGNVGDIQTNGHTILVPLKTAQTETICNNNKSLLGELGTEIYDVAYLQKGVRILVSDTGIEDIQVLDRDATDGTAQLNLPNGCYEIWARALGKPGGCMDVDTLICYNYDAVLGDYVPVNCATDLSDDKYVLVGHLDVDRSKGKPHWINATADLLPVETGVGTNKTGYFDFFWQIFNDNLRLLQLRVIKVADTCS